jgi:SAM-dependent methyltransferase
MAGRTGVASDRLVGNHADCVPETRFGVWFQGTTVWFRHVLLESLAELERLLARPDARFARILDVGCGRGRAFRTLADRFRPGVIVGIDVDPGAIERAAQAAAGCPCRVEPRVADVTKLELPDASIDLAFCHQTLHHVRDQTSALAELHRVLAPGGVLLLAESCRPFIDSPLVRLLFRHPMEVQRSADEYLALLRSAGFGFRRDQVSTPDPRWARRDLGLGALLGLRARPAPGGPTQLCVAAVRSACSP